LPLRDNRNVTETLALRIMMNRMIRQGGFGRFNTIIHLALLSLFLLAGFVIVRLFSLPFWFVFAPLIFALLLLVIASVVDNLRAYYREPTLLSGGRTRAEINRDLRKRRKEEANM